MLELKVPRSLAPTAFHTASNRPPTACTGPRKRSLAPLELPPNPPFPFKQIPGEGVRGQPNGVLPFGLTFSASKGSLICSLSGDVGRMVGTIRAAPPATGVRGGWKKKSRLEKFFAGVGVPGLARKKKTVAVFS